MSKCTSCKKLLDGKSVIIPCICCNLLFHGTPTCAGISPAEASILILENSDKLLVFRCLKCKESGGISNQLYKTLEGLNDLGKRVTESCDSLKAFHKDFNELKLEVKTLRNKNNTLEKKCSALKDKIAALPDLDTIEQELESRQFKKNNLIIYGLSKPKPTDSINSDLLLAKNALKDINNLDLSNIKVNWIGKSDNHNPQPLLVKMISKQEVIRVIKNKNKLPSNLSVSTDKTFYQRQQLQDLRKIVDDHNCLNNDKKTIKYVKGKPCIVNADENQE